MITSATATTKHENMGTEYEIINTSHNLNKLNITHYIFIFLYFCFVHLERRNTHEKTD